MIIMITKSSTQSEVCVLSLSVTSLLYQTSDWVLLFGKILPFFMVLYYHKIGKILPLVAKTRKNFLKNKKFFKKWFLNHFLNMVKMYHFDHKWKVRALRARPCLCPVGSALMPAKSEPKISRRKGSGSKTPCRSELKKWSFLALFWKKRDFECYFLWKLSRRDNEVVKNWQKIDFFLKNRLIIRILGPLYRSVYNFGRF